MIILGLDCATKTGWCLYDSVSQKIILSGVESFARKKNESTGMMFLKFRQWLLQVLETKPRIDLVIFEMPYTSKFASSNEITLGLVSHVQTICEELLFQYTKATPTELKKFATGKGNSGKDKMIEAVLPILGRPPIDDNEADAVHIARFAAQSYSSDSIRIS